MGKLFVTRHGEVDFNVEGRYIGHLDVELNNKGLEQSSEMAKQIPQLNIDLIITSPLKRCSQTAAKINESIRVPILEMAEFKEGGLGIFEGLTKKECQNKYPDLWARNITRIYNDAPPGGETIKEVEERVFKGLEKIKSDYPDKNILIVTHGFTAKLINKYFNQLTEEEFFNFELENTGVIEYSFN